MSLEENPRLEDIQDFIEKAPSAYVIISPTATTSPNFPHKGYAGPSGRLDVVARAMTAPLHFERDALAIGILLGPPRPPIIVMGYKDCLGLGERAAIEAIRRALRGRPPQGCIALAAGHDFILHVLVKSGFTIVYLNEKGDDISARPGAINCRCAYFAGAHVDVPPQIESDILRVARETVSVGPMSLLTSHVFAFVAWLRMMVTVLQSGGPVSGSFYTTSRNLSRPGGV